VNCYKAKANIRWLAAHVEDIGQMALDTAPRFAFGANWQDYASRLDEGAILHAEASLRTLLATNNLTGKRFLDIGCGSGIVSLVARQLGATVHSFDYDATSVAVTTALREHSHREDTEWTVETGSVLDMGYLAKLGQFDVVYSWGVLHHTGAMWAALKNVDSLVAPGGRLAIAIYNDQGGASRRWARIKQLYNRMPRFLRFLIIGPAFVRLWGPSFMRDFLRGEWCTSWRTYGKNRGMSPWYDLIDWIGGWPFEVARPEAIFEFFRDRGYVLEYLKTSGGSGCNEFVFKR
jgi:2-polyprenyl-3-methyl-5-hydroxy-6-metoxy-1,4-benzoquinol methylase